LNASPLLSGVETFIWFDDKVGRELQVTLIAAVASAVQVDVTSGARKRTNDNLSTGDKHPN
jgi:hypothetical protein